MSNGWIKLHRRIAQDSMWEKKPFSPGQAWVDLILLANHKDGYITVRGNHVDVKRGQVGWSELSLSERWGWSRGKVNRFLSQIEHEREQKIVQQKNRITTVITILNYDLYQGVDTTDGTTGNTTDAQQTIQQTDTNKNGKKEKKVKKKGAGGEIPAQLKGLELYEKDEAFLKKFDSLFAQWKSAYPRVDIDLEIKKAHIWELNQPASKRKKNRGSFISNWLGRANSSLPELPDDDQPHSQSQIDEIYRAMED